MDTPIRFAIIGSGWRSQFYARIAAEYPERFHVSAVLVRNENKAKLFLDRYGILPVFNMEELTRSNPEFIVVAVSKSDICSVIEKCVEAGFPVLSETPPALRLDDLNKIWNWKLKRGAKIQAAEQYQFMPEYQARLEIIKRGYLGEITSLSISDAHDYHAVSLIRKFLGVSKETAVITGESFDYPIIETGSRAGIQYAGKKIVQKRDRYSFLFENGKTAFYDFSSEQYHSRIRSRHFMAQGERGELFDDKALWIDEKNLPCSDRLARQQREDKKTDICFQNKVIYHSDFPALNDDEIGISACLTGMREYLRSGEEFYPLSDALQDAYFSILMQQAREGRSVISQNQSWNEKLS